MQIIKIVTRVTVISLMLMVVLGLNDLLISEVKLILECWYFVDCVVMSYALWYNIRSVFVDELILLRWFNGVNLNWVGVWDVDRIISDEGLVLARLMCTMWGDVLVVRLPVDDLVVDHVGKVLKTVELDRVVTMSVDNNWVVAGAAGAR